jgi:predicted kinase
MEETKRDKSGINKGIYTKQASQQTYERLLQLAGSVLNAGYSVIIDAAFLKEDQRQEFYKYAKKVNVPFIILHSKVNMDIQHQRLRIRQQQNRDASDADNKILKQQIIHHEPLTNAELSHTITIDTTHDIILKEVIVWLEKQ